MTETGPTATGPSGVVDAPPGGTVTTVAAGPVKMEKIIEHNEPSSLPELDWFWRRLFVFALTTFFCALVAWYMQRASDATVRTLLRAAIWSIDFLVLVYIVGASAEKVVQIAAALKSTRRETTREVPANAPPEPDPRPDLAIPPMPGAKRPAAPPPEE